MKKNKLLLFVLLCMVPSMVFASSGSDEMPIFAAVGIEAFVSIHMTLFVLVPLSNLFGGDNPKALLKKMFIGRIIFLLFFDFFVTTFIAFFDFIAVFIGGFLVVPICSFIKNKNPFKSTPTVTFPAMREMSSNSVTISGTVTKKTVNGTTVVSKSTINGIVLKCVKCNKEVPVTAKFCPVCGLAMSGNNIKVEESKIGSIAIPPKKRVLPSQFDNIYSLSEAKMLEEFINRELVKSSIDKNSKLIPAEILKKKKILNIIFSILLFTYISMIFFHFPLMTYVLGLIILVIFYKVSSRYNLINYLIKEVKSRPSEKVSNIVMSVKSTFVQDDTRSSFLIYLAISVVFPLIIFWNPRILYEKIDNGYAVRFYTFGVTNFQTATIPATYKGENVTVLRGNTFSNMPFLREVSLPDTITEIRGQAFKNDFSLYKVNIPKNLEYLGGGAFYNCSSLTSVELPDTLYYLGGEAFYEAYSLENVKLSNNLTEIRGNTFEDCTSLKSIVIPDSVTRIGGHAFYGNSELEKVVFTENSQLKEIGSSAFRQCTSLKEITLPQNVDINYRAFKESPTVIHYFGVLEVSEYIHTVYNDGTPLYIHSEKYGDIEIHLSNIGLDGGHLKLTLNFSGGIDMSIHITCNGSTYYIYDDFYISTFEYDYIPTMTSFVFYY